MRAHRHGLGYGVPMARVKCRTTWRERWRNASLKTSFMVYMLGFLVAALVLSSITAAVFADLQNQVTEDAYELSGLYLYDEDTDQLVPARNVEVTTEGSTAFVQTIREGMETLNPATLPADTSVVDASDYSFSAETLAYESDGSVSIGTETDAVEIGELTAANIPEYDAAAREQFDTWLTQHPDSPYASFFPQEGQDGSSADSSGLITSPIGYYLSTPPSAGASALSTLFGLLTFLMFPLWFGLCIFLAARRFFRMRLAPGIDTLDHAAAKIADQDLDFTVAYDRDDELGRLASSFETMRANLVETQRDLWRTAEERKRLNAAFAHDLRTPLTVLKGKIELLEARLQSGTTSPEQLSNSVASLSNQVERLERYVAAMSGLQKLEDRAAVRRREPFDAVAGAIEDAGEGLAPGANRSFALSISVRCDHERPELCVDRAFVGEVADNLVSNALRFAQTHVDARLDVEDDFLVLIVEDDGPGFSPEALARGCSPFFSETPSKDHFGLGLNIASLLCEKHGGSLLLENQPQGGARVIARFRLNK